MDDIKKMKKKSVKRKVAVGVERGSTSEKHTLAVQSVQVGDDGERL